MKLAKKKILKKKRFETHHENLLHFIIFDGCKTQLKTLFKLSLLQSFIICKCYKRNVNTNVSRQLAVNSFYRITLN